MSSLDKNTVFLSNKENYEVYRIPALFYDQDRNILLAFAEKRRTSNDASSEVLVMKTGRIIKDETTLHVNIEWSKAKNVVEKKHMNDYRPMNPCPVYEKTTKTLFLFFVCIEGTISEAWQRFWGINKARLCYITTKDAGETWSGVTDLTDKLPQMKEWAVFAVGPGHGLQTQSGRLIIPAYGYGSCSSSCFCITCFCGISRAICLYSDDKGCTWQFSNMLEEKSVECEMAEVCGDKENRYIYCNARNEGGYRVEAVSDNNGEDFIVLPPAEKLVETGYGCQGSVVSFPAQTGAADVGQEPRWLLYSHPTSRSKRVDLGVYLNKTPLDSSAWSEPWIMNKGPSGYSELAYIGDGCFACLLECGDTSEIEQIACTTFSYKQVSQGNGKSTSAVDTSQILSNRR